MEGNIIDAFTQVGRIGVAVVLTYLLVARRQTYLTQ